MFINHQFDWDVWLRRQHRQCSWFSTIFFLFFNCFYSYELACVLQYFRVVYVQFMYYSSCIIRQKNTNIIICYGIAMENALATERIYAEWFPNRRHPSHITISQCVRRSKESGFLLPQRQNRVNTPVRRHVNIDERVLREFEENPSFSIRRVARILGITRDMVHRILKQNGLHPFYY